MIRRLTLLALVLGLPTQLAAQTIAGVAVRAASSKPVGAARVLLLDDSTHVVTTTVADSSTSTFYLDAPHPGRYRVLLFAGGISYVSAPESLAAGQSIEREFRLPDGELTQAPVYFMADVTTPARPMRMHPAPRYPDGLRARGVPGSVTTTFVVDSSGHVEKATLQVLQSTDHKFSDAVREALPDMRFTPAVLDGKHVRQVVQYTFAFGFVNNVPPGDIVITALSTEIIKRSRSITPPSPR